MGRAGAGNNAEVVVGLLIGAKFGFLFTCIVSIDPFWDEGLDSFLGFVVPCVLDHSNKTPN
jgi:hypothetical protein